MAKKRKTEPNRMQTEYATASAPEETAVEAPEEIGVVCPHCQTPLHGHHRVVRETRRLAGGVVKRRRSCPVCLRSTWTEERRVR